MVKLKIQTSCWRGNNTNKQCKIILLFIQCISNKDQDWVQKNIYFKEKQLLNRIWVDGQSDKKFNPAYKRVNVKYLEISLKNGSPIHMRIDFMQVYTVSQKWVSLVIWNRLLSSLVQLNQIWYNKLTITTAISTINKLSSLVISTINKLSSLQSLVQLTNYHHLSSLPCSSFSFSCNRLFRSIICCVFWKVKSYWLKKNWISKFF